MTIAGDTMGTLDLDLRGAMRLFSKIGYQGHRDLLRHGRSTGHHHGC